MIVSFCTSHILCWWRTGSVELLSETENAPTNNVQPTSTLTDAIELSRGIKRPDLRNHSAGQKILTERTANPHSAINTTHTHRSRPRGFLP
jgi:hypothetical protein